MIGEVEDVATPDEYVTVMTGVGGGPLGAEIDRRPACPIRSDFRGDRRVTTSRSFCSSSGSIRTDFRGDRRVWLCSLRQSETQDGGHQTERQRALERERRREQDPMVELLNAGARLATTSS